MDRFEYEIGMVRTEYKVQNNTVRAAPILWGRLIFSLVVLRGTLMATLGRYLTSYLCRREFKTAIRSQGLANPHHIP